MIQKTFKNKYYNCYIANIISVALYYNRSFFMLFSDHLYFTYNNTKNLIAEKISVSRPDYDLDECLLQFHFIKLYQNFFDTKVSMISHIKKILSEGGNVLLYTDVYYCNWNALYMQRHINHNILIVGYSNKKFLCLDPYFTQNLLFISEDSAVLCEGHCKDIQILKEKETVFSGCLTVLKDNIISYSRDQNIQTSFREFAIDIENINVSNELCGKLNIYDIPLIRKLKNIEDNRMCYIELLNIIKNNFSYSLEKVEKNLLESVHYWNRLRMLMFKCLIKQKIEYKSDKLIQLIKIISDYEVQIADDLVEYYKSYEKY